MNGATKGYDVIGDIHGHATALENLLAKLGYTKRDGVWSHSERLAIFVGDFVDRGDENMRACRIAMDMTGAGTALAVMGNHEFNTIGLNTPDPDHPGEFLRRHTPKNLCQAEKTRLEMEGDPEGAKRILAWMRSLPLWLDLPDLRVVHAVWSPASMVTLTPYLDTLGALTGQGMVHASRKNNSVHASRETLLNGIEQILPNGGSFYDKDGHKRYEARLKWWLAGTAGHSWRDAAIAPPKVVAQLPDTLLPDDALSERDDDKRPVLFGHYWQTEPLPIYTPRHACVDASVVNGVDKGGCLAAYRFSGERELKAENFVYAV